MRNDAIRIVHAFWHAMSSNDFDSVGAVLSDDYVLEWPQSNERIRGRGNFAAMNKEYPTHGHWRFCINNVVGDALEVVTDVSITDGVQVARAISFFTITGDKISKMVEFWADDYPAPANRRHLVEPIRKD